MTVEQDRAVAGPAPAAAVLRRAAVRATMAASVRNMQPWRLGLRSDRLDILADRRRRLPVFDRSGRQLHLSCGCALFNARVALAGAGLGEYLTRGPGWAEPDLLAVLWPDPQLRPNPTLAALDSVLAVRRTSWGPFTAPIVDGVLPDLLAAARGSGAALAPVDPAVAASSARLAARILDADPAYLAELRAWRTLDPTRRDGLVCGRRPGVGPDHDAGTWLPADEDWNAGSCLVLGTSADDPGSWLRAGEALQHVLLVAAGLGVAVHVMSVSIEVPVARGLLAEAAPEAGFPQLVLRVGTAPEAPPSARRRLVDVIMTA